MLKARGAGKLSGTTSTSTWQHQAIRNPRLSLGASPPPPAPPPPPLPTPPPNGEILNPRTEGRTLTFEVKGPDAKLVVFRLSLQGPDAGTLTVTIPAHSRVYPDFQMKRVEWSRTTGPCRSTPKSLGSGQEVFSGKRALRLIRNRSRRWLYIRRGFLREPRRCADELHNKNKDSIA